MYKIITAIHDLDKSVWDNFIINHPDANVFHTSEMVELYSSSKKDFPIVIACLSESNQILGLIIGDLQKEFPGVLGKISSRVIVFGGPLLSSTDPEILNILLREFNKKCHNIAIYCQIRNLSETRSNRKVFYKYGFKYQDHLNILIDLKQGQEKIWEGFHPTRRKQISRGFKRGVETQIKDNLTFSELTSCYRILSEVYNEIRLPFPTIQYFENAILLLNKSDYFKAVLAISMNEIIGFRFLLVNRNTIYDWYAASSSEHNDKYPNDILPWEIMRWGATQGYTTFDFGGAGKPGVRYGVRDYKLKFGGELVNYGRYEKIFSPGAMFLAKTGFKIWQLIAKR